MKFFSSFLLLLVYRQLYAGLGFGITMFDVQLSVSLVREGIFVEYSLHYFWEGCLS